MSCDKHQSMQKSSFVVVQTELAIVEFHKQTIEDFN